MIDNVLNILKNKLNDSENGLKDQDGEIAVVDDIAKHEDDTSGLDNKVVITLLSVEEESTMKNTPRYHQVKVGDIPVRYDLESAPAYLNLYVMISANRARYSNALINISKVIEIFQVNNVLEYGSTPETSFKFRIELHPIPFEQLSYVWGLLGGKVMPSALYKISVIKIAPEKDPVKIGLIDEVHIKSIKVD
ncbi:DUF4255 domain-containing protein [Chryseobacterium luquanense]|uniref:DUF4255 domain-containing protein n=1 Tax=Chryseobacterium luquanense TaxID=2983766 RepID=A0ABT3Y4E4_9FLAO|nr:DUF4255 domain-containing protein [Chryseobacterium luquanense]MCX8533025.1 DUF4255 domain-containing protein [Chryseobacterium luquanense]